HCSRAGKRWAARRRPTSAGTTPASSRSPIAPRWPVSSRRPSMRRVVPLLSALVLLSAVPASAQLDQILKEVETYARPGVGTPTAATDYFKDKTSASLTLAFRPIVDRAMDEVGTVKQYNELLGQAKTIPFLKTEHYDLDRHVVGKALDGLFHVVGDEERKIRSDPAARVTSLLKDVFGK